MSQSQEDARNLASVYADALFALARESSATGAVRSDLDSLVELKRSQPDFALLMDSESLDSEHRRDLLERLLRGKVRDETLQTLLVMNRRGRAGLLDALADSFRALQQEAANEVDVIVTSAVALSDGERSTIEQQAAAVSGRKPLTSWCVDPDLLGGLIVQIGDVRYDNSVRRHLRIVQNRLLERADRGLPVGVME